MSKGAKCPTELMSGGPNVLDSTWLPWSIKGANMPRALGLLKKNTIFEDLFCIFILLCHVLCLWSTSSEKMKEIE